MIRAMRFNEQYRSRALGGHATPVGYPAQRRTLSAGVKAVLLLIAAGLPPSAASITSICNAPQSSIEQLSQDPLLRSFFEKTCGVQLAPLQPIREELPASKPLEIAQPPVSGPMPPAPREDQLNVLEQAITKTPETQRPPRETLVQVTTPELDLVPRASESLERPKDSLTLDSAYFAGDMRDNYSYKTFLLDVQWASNRLFEEVHTRAFSDASMATRGAFLAGATVFSTYLLPQDTYHEWGHFSRRRAMGSTTSTLHLGSWDPAGSTKGDTNFFSYWLSEVQNWNLDGAYVRYPITDVLTANAHSGSATAAIYQGAGINNSVYLAETQDEEFFLGERSTVFALGFNLKKKNETLLYQVTGDMDEELNDLNQLVATYRSSGIDPNLSISDIYRAHYWSLLSGSNISAALAMYRYVVRGQLVYEPLMIGSFLFPNQSNYYSSRGLTRKVQSGYRFSRDLKLIFGVEYVERGQPFREVNFGSYVRHGPWSLLGKVTLGDSQYTNLELKVARRIARTLELGLYGALWDSRSLLGERNTLVVRNNKTAQGGLRLSYKY